MFEDHYELAWSAHDRGDWFEAVQHWQMALRDDPDEPDILVMLASTLQQLEQHNAALDAIQRAIAIPGEHLADAYSTQGMILRDTGDYAGAIAAFHNRMRLRPDGLGYTLELYGNREAALANYRRALELEPENDEWLAHLGRCLARNDPAAGIPYMQKALTFDPDYSYTHEQLADALSQLHRRDEALVHYRRAVELNPDRAWCRLSLAQELATNRDGSDDEEAEAQFLRAIALDPTSSTALSLYGVFLRTRDRIADAKRAFRDALSIDPKDEYAAEWLRKIRITRRKR